MKTRVVDLSFADFHRRIVGDGLVGHSPGLVLFATIFVALDPSGHRIRILAPTDAA